MKRKENFSFMYFKHDGHIIEECYSKKNMGKNACNVATRITNKSHVNKYIYNKDKEKLNDSCIEEIY